MEEKGAGLGVVGAEGEDAVEGVDGGESVAGDAFAESEIVASADVTRIVCGYAAPEGNGSGEVVGAGVDDGEVGGGDAVEWIDCESGLVLVRGGGGLVGEEIEEAEVGVEIGVAIGSVGGMFLLLGALEEVFGFGYILRVPFDDGLCVGQAEVALGGSLIADGDEVLT